MLSKVKVHNRVYVLLVSLFFIFVSIDIYNGEYYPLNNDYVVYFQFIRVNNLVFRLVILLACLISGIFVKYKWQWKRVLFILLSIVVGAKYILDAQMYGIYYVIYASVLVMIAGSLRNRHEVFVNSLLVAALFEFGVFLIQGISCWECMFVGGRYIGLTGNPNHLGVKLAIISIVLMSFWRVRPTFKFSVVFILILLVILTGSRTAIIIMLPSLIITLIQSLRLTALVSILGFGLYVSNILKLLKISALRSTNTRADVWARSMKSSFEHPFIGVPLNGSKMEVVENSFLAAFENLGIMGFFLFLLLVASCLRFRDRSRLLIGLSIIIGGVFEGYLFGLNSMGILILLVL